MWTVHCIPYTVHCTLPSLCSVHFLTFTVQNKYYKLHFTCAVHFLTFDWPVHNTSKQGVLTVSQYAPGVVAGKPQFCGAFQCVKLLPMVLQECLVRRSSIMLHAWEGCRMMHAWQCQAQAASCCAVALMLLTGWINPQFEQDWRLQESSTLSC